MTFWILGCCAYKPDKDGKITFGHFAGYRICATEGEARRQFLALAQQSRPDFAVTELTCQAVEPEELRRALGEIITATAH